MFPVKGHRRHQEQKTSAWWWRCWHRRPSGRALALFLPLTPLISPISFDPRGAELPWGAMHRIPCSVKALNCGPFCVARRAKLILYMSVYHGQREGQVARFFNEFHLLMTCRAGHVSSFQSARSLLLGETCDVLLRIHVDRQTRKSEPVLA